MPLLLTLFLLVACSPVPWPSAWLGGPAWLAPVLTAAITASVVGRAWIANRRALLLIDQPFRQSEALIGFHRSRSRQGLWQAGGFAAALTAIGWGHFVQTQLMDAEGVLVPGVEVVIIAPYMAMVFLSWLAYYPVERRVSELAGQPAMTRRGYLAFQFRQQLALVCIPLVLIILEQSVIRAAPGLVETAWFKVVAIGFLFGLLVMAPWGLRALLGLRPLPAGQLRDRLSAAARRAGFRFSDLLIWDTRGAVGNAMIVGFWSRPRYVLFTDRLLDELSHAELEAVFGHEMGHAKHRHVLLYLVFLALSLSALSGMATFAARVASKDASLRWLVESLDPWQTLVALLVLAAYVVLAFGFLSRRCEREADLFGCRAVSCGREHCQGHGDAGKAGTGPLPCATGVDLFTSALERVAVMNGVSRSKPGWMSSWQHSTIAARVAFLERVRNDPGLDRRYRARLRRFKFGLLAVMGGVVTALVCTGDLPSLWP